MNIKEIVEKEIKELMNIISNKDIKKENKICLKKVLKWIFSSKVFWGSIVLSVTMVVFGIITLITKNVIFGGIYIFSTLFFLFLVIFGCISTLLDTIKIYKKFPDSFTSEFKEYISIRKKIFEKLDNIQVNYDYDYDFYFDFSNFLNHKIQSKSKLFDFLFKGLSIIGIYSALKIANNFFADIKNFLNSNIINQVILSYPIISIPFAFAENKQINDMELLKSYMDEWKEKKNQDENYSKNANCIICSKHSINAEYHKSKIVDF